MKTQINKLSFSSDYMEGAHKNIISKLADSNMQQTPGYGTDCYSESAKEKIRAACNCPDAEIYFLVGGTQTNATVIDSILHSYQGVIAADTGHISLHEAGAIEFGGHKVLPIPQHLGKISATQIKSYVEDYYHDENHEHMIMPGMVYLSQPTEYGTLYSLQELTEISSVCREYSIPLYIDGARLAYALASDNNNVTLPDLAKLCDVFYIGGTKCGALFGEAVVVPVRGTIPHFFTIIKQHGALLAKGRLLGIQFDELFKDNLYCNIGSKATMLAKRIEDLFTGFNIPTLMKCTTNQVFLIMENDKLDTLSKYVDYGFWEKYDQNHTVIRLATSWATDETQVEQLEKILKQIF